MDEIISMRLCFNCDRKYSKGHKCSENKLFYIDCEEDEDQELEPPQDIYLEDYSNDIFVGVTSHTPRIYFSYGFSLFISHN